MLQQTIRSDRPYRAQGLVKENRDLANSSKRHELPGVEAVPAGFCGTIHGRFRGCRWDVTCSEKGLNGAQQTLMSTDYGGDEGSDLDSHLLTVRDYKLCPRCEEEGDQVDRINETPFQDP